MLFCKLYSDHLCAQDMAFEKLVWCLPMASLMGVAFKSWKAAGLQLSMLLCKLRTCWPKRLSIIPYDPVCSPFWLSA